MASATMTKGQNLNFAVSASAMFSWLAGIPKDSTTRYVGTDPHPVSAGHIDRQTTAAADIQALQDFYNQQVASK
jgi:hypothetical protein